VYSLAGSVEGNRLMIKSDVICLSLGVRCATPRLAKSRKHG